MTIELGDVINDHELERRVRATLNAVMPLLDTHANQHAGESLEEPGLTVVDFERAGVSPRRARSVVAVLSLVAAAVAVFVVLAQREPIQGPAGDAASTTPAPVVVGAWYNDIRPFLPDGFDQVALMHAGDDAVVFRAWRTGTGQTLDVTIGLRSGDLKETSDTVTDIDASGTWYETTSDAALITTDGRLIGVSCGVLVDTGGTGISDSSRDYCGEPFDNLDIGPAGRRAIVTALAARFPTTTLDTAFGTPAPPTTDLARTAALITEVLPNVDGTVAGSQWGGVVQYINLTGGPGPASSELSIVHGVTPPRAADANPAFGPLPASDPSTRMVRYDDIAIGWMVSDTGTGFHVATTDLSADNLRLLGILLERLAQDAITGRDTPTTVPTAATSTTAGPIIVPDPGRFHPEEGAYVIAPGDQPSTIASKFKVTFQDLLDINNWTILDNAVPEFPTVGTTIRIPPGWTEPSATTSNVTPTASCAEGATEISLPNVAGLSYRDAAAELTRLGAAPQAMLEQTPGGTSTDSDPVVNQRTPPGATIDCGATVELVVAFNPGPLHIVQSGDTFTSIAAAGGLTVDQLLAFNGLEADTVLKVGVAVRLTAPPGPPPTT